VFGSKFESRVTTASVGLQSRASGDSDDPLLPQGVVLLAQLDTDVRVSPRAIAPRCLGPTRRNRVPCHRRPIPDPRELIFPLRPPVAVTHDEARVVFLADSLTDQQMRSGDSLVLETAWTTPTSGSPERGRGALLEEVLDIAYGAAGACPPWSVILSSGCDRWPRVVGSSPGSTSPG
jgi:hypothetical protein